ncbi:MAG: 3-keto-disaccharide hydrolase [Roseimicrobium sp.]
MKFHSLLITSCAALALSLNLTAGEGKALFNGIDLTGWEGNPVLWSVKDGCITGITPPDPADPKKGLIKHNTFLVWKAGKVSDFELTFKYRIEKGNSGIQYRSKELAPGAFGPIISGYQADFEAGTTYSGILYEERGRGILAKRGEKTVIKPATDDGKKPVVEVTGSVGESAAIQANIKSEDWNEYKIIAKGNHVQHFINGMQTVDVTDEDSVHAPKEGLLALQIHQGPPMVVQFKDLVLTELK